MKKLTTVVLTNKDVLEALEGAVHSTVKINIPRKADEDGVVQAPYCTSVVGSDEFLDALAGFMQIDVAELDDVSMSSKKDGSLELTY